MADTYYDRIGGEQAVRLVADGFYDTVDESYPRLAGMLPADTTVTRRKLFLYLCGWLGGPQLYTARYGHPRLRMRHLPFAIDEDGVRQWLEAMEVTLRRCEVEAALIDELMALFGPLAHHMRNQPLSATDS